MRLAALTPVKSLWLEGLGAVWDDNGFDLKPDEARIVSAPSLDVTTVALRWPGGQGLFDLRSS